MEMSKTPHTHGNIEEYTFYMLQDACDVKYSYKRLIDISLSDRMSVFWSQELHNPSLAG
jgi:hypothetical protein